jgi:cyclohexadienyl dehydratase
MMRVTIGKMASAVALALACSWGFAAFAESGRLERILKEQRLRVCVWPDYYGITYRNPKTQQLSGVDVDMANELGKDLGVRVSSSSTARSPG